MRLLHLLGPSFPSFSTRPVSRVATTHALASFPSRIFQWEECTVDETDHF